jgi:hypothetical protein
MRNLVHIGVKKVRGEKDLVSLCEAWAAGVQMHPVSALKIGDRPLLNFCRFMQNGGTRCGYVLKPEFLRESGELPSSIEKMKIYDEKVPVLRIKIEILSAQQLRFFDRTPDFQS